MGVLAGDCNQLPPRLISSIAPQSAKKTSPPAGLILGAQGYPSRDNQASCTLPSLIAFTSLYIPDEHTPACGKRTGPIGVYRDGRHRVEGSRSIGSGRLIPRSGADHPLSLSGSGGLPRGQWAGVRTGRRPSPSARLSGDFLGWPAALACGVAG